MKIKTAKTNYRVYLFTLIPLLATGCATPYKVVDESANFTPDTNIVKQKGDWSLVWDDEFTGQKIDRTKWQSEVNCWGGGNQEQQCYTNSPDNAFVANGFLTIRALKQRTSGPAVPEDWPDAGKATASLPYSSARLRTKGLADWKYGRIEVRAKLPQGQGTWPAIWMLPSDFVYGPWAASGEIDIMEAVNLHTTYQDEEGKVKQENRINGTLHFGQNWPKNVHSGVAYDFGDDKINPADDFHTYAIEWEKGEIRWYVDNHHYATQTMDGWWTHYKNKDGKMVRGPEDAPFNQKFHLLLNLALGGSWAGQKNDKGISSSLNQADMLVDYVRVYQCDKNTVTGKGCASHLKDNAVHSKGVPEPSLTVKAVDTKASTLQIMHGTTLNNSFVLSGWDDMSNDALSTTDQGLDIKIIGLGNAYIASPAGTLDMSRFANGELSFDLQIIDGSAQALRVKMDSGYPNVAAVPLRSLPKQGQWKHITIKLSDIIKASNDFDISAVVNPLVFEPIKGNKLHFRVKNIQFTQ